MIDEGGEWGEVLKKLETGQNNVFLSGKAGTGKSTLINIFRERTKKQVVTLAPTGIAAINVRGQTIHSFFKLPPRTFRSPVLFGRLGRIIFWKYVEYIKCFGSIASIGNF